jgi:hypothetical protein
MSKQRDGGPLSPIYLQAADGKLRCQERGIDLRTYLVGQAIAGSGIAWLAEITPEKVAADAVKIADAAIKEIEL